jgi:hypothetical protein
VDATGWNVRNCKVGATSAVNPGLGFHWIHIFFRFETEVGISNAAIKWNAGSYSNSSGLGGKNRREASVNSWIFTS